jgi:hypothetical protein
LDPTRLQYDWDIRFEVKCQIIDGYYQLSVFPPLPSTAFLFAHRHNSTYNPTLFDNNLLAIAIHDNDQLNPRTFIIYVTFHGVGFSSRTVRVGSFTTG